MPPNQQPADIAQRISTIERHLHALGLSADDMESIARNLHGLSLAVRKIEAEMLALHHAQRTDADIAAQRAQEVVYQYGPSEVKVMK